MSAQNGSLATLEEGLLMLEAELAKHGVSSHQLLRDDAVFLREEGKQALMTTVSALFNRGFRDCYLNISEVDSRPLRLSVLVFPMSFKEESDLEAFEDHVLWKESYGPFTMYEMQYLSETGDRTEYVKGLLSHYVVRRLEKHLAECLLAFMPEGKGVCLGQRDEDVVWIRKASGV